MADVCEALTCGTSRSPPLRNDWSNQYLYIASLRLFLALLGLFVHRMQRSECRRQGPCTEGRNSAVHRVGVGPGRRRSLLDDSLGVAVRELHHQ